MDAKRLLTEFMELVQIDSETKHERAIADDLKERLSAIGFAVQEDDSAARSGHGAGNLIATLPATDEAGDRIYFTVHMDTVTPGVGIQPRVEKGFVVSDGTTILGADDKAGVAALLEMARSLREENIAHGQIQLVITAGEESGLAGARQLDRTLVDASYGFAVDSDGPVGDIVTAAPYQAKLTTEITGRTAHAGVAPEKGVSAITVAAKAVAAMKLGRIDEETTANIGHFQGSGPTNIVCDRVLLIAEARSLEEAKLRAQTDHMVAEFERAADAMGAQAQTDVQVVYPGFKTGAESEVVQRAKAAAQAIGRTPRLRVSGGGSDANIISSFGIPTVVLGVGYEDIHTVKERMPVAELEALAAMLIEIARSTVR